MGYKIVYELVSGDLQRSSYTGADQNTIVLTGLKASSNVTVQVLAYNENGQGPHSNNVFVMTLPERMCLLSFVGSFY